MSDSPPRRDELRAPALMLALAMVLMAAGPLAGRAAQAAHPRGGRAYTVTIEGMRFAPQTVTVHVGDKITWINKDPFPHTVTATGGRFDSRQIAPDGSWSYVARKAGEYGYMCSLHVTMKGRVLVR